MKESFTATISPQNPNGLLTQAGDQHPNPQAMRLPKAMALNGGTGCSVG